MQCVNAKRSMDYSCLNMKLKRGNLANCKFKTLRVFS